MNTVCIYPQPAQRRECSTCHEPMLNVGRDVWVCVKQRTEARIIPEARRESVRAMAAERVPSAPF